MTPEQRTEVERRIVYLDERLGEASKPKSWYMGDARMLLAEIDRLAAEAARLTRASRARADYDLRCTGCGAPHWIDTVIPNEAWNQIATDADLLCMLCIDERLQTKGLTARAEFYYSGDALQSRLYAESYGHVAEVERQRTALRAVIMLTSLHLPRHCDCDGECVMCVALANLDAAWPTWRDDAG